MTSKESMMPLLVAILIFLMIFLMACQTKNQQTKLDLKWHFMDFPPGETQACLNEKDVKKLRETLIRCESIENKLDGL